MAIEEPTGLVQTLMLQAYAFHLDYFPSLFVKWAYGALCLYPFAMVLYFRIIYQLENQWRKRFNKLKTYQNELR
ncbi:MAG: hypothetical protein U5K51_11275 [Flavobacteriaceae bacterium]|nr:hypothetical protein [Flavobacteriaceae bacterium]